MLHPLQHPFTPCIHKARNEDQNKDDAFYNGEQTKLTQPNSPGKKEHGFDIEHQKDQRKDVILSLELHPAISYGLNTAFVCHLLNRIGLLWSENPGCRNCAHGDNQPNDKEQTNVNPLTHRFSMANLPFTAKFDGEIVP